MGGTPKSKAASNNRIRQFNCKKTKANQDVRCLICDANVDKHSGFNILCTVLPLGGGLLCDNINRVLKRNIDAVTARTTILCDRCFSLFDELDVAESKCADICKNINAYYVATCEIYNDEEPISVPGVATQTDTNKEPPNTNCLPAEDMLPPLSDQFSEPVDMQSSSACKKKRGRPKKSDIERINARDSISLGKSENNNVNPKRTPKSKKKSGNDGGAADTSQEENQSNKYETSDGEGELISFSETIRKDESSGEWKPVKRECSSGEEEFQSPSVASPETSCDVYEVPDENGEDEKMQLSDSQDGEGVDENDDAFNSDESDTIDDEGKKRKGRGKTQRKGERLFLPAIHECPQCGKKWRTVTELKSHIASHSQLRPFVCEMCGQAYKMKKALDIHIGMHNGIHPFVCEFCNKSFTQKVGLEKHLPIHTGVQRFQCDLCGKRFIHQKSFNIHKMTHTGEKNIHCPICNLAVFSQSHLKRHYRVHTGERPYACKTCGKKFAEKYNLNAHQRVHDSTTHTVENATVRRKPHVCPICGTTWERKQKLTDHITNSHGIWLTNSVDNGEVKTAEYYIEESTGVIQQLQNHSQNSPLLVQTQPQQQRAGDIISLQQHVPSEQQNAHLIRHLQQDATAANQQHNMILLRQSQQQQNSDQQQNPNCGNTLLHHQTEEHAPTQEHNFSTHHPLAMHLQPSQLVQHTHHLPPPALQPLANVFHLVSTGASSNVSNVSDSNHHNTRITVTNNSIAVSTL